MTAHVDHVPHLRKRERTKGHGDRSPVVEVKPQKRHGHRRLIRNVAHHRGYHVQPGQLGGAPAALPGDQLVGAVGARRPNDDRLQHTDFTNRRGQRLQSW